MSDKYQGLPVDEPSILTFFNRVDALVGEKGLHTAIRPDSNNTVLNILCGDREIAFVDGYSGSVCGKPLEGMGELWEDMEAIRLSIPFENSKEWEADRQNRWEAYQDVAESLMGGGRTGCGDDIMSATVGAALKKIAVALLTDKRVLKTLGGVVLGILIIIIMPVVAVISVFNGNIELDTNALQQQIVAQMTAEQKEELQFIEDTMNAIETEMTKAGFPERVKEAQVLFVLALSDYAHEPDFVTKLVGCFAKDQTDEQLIAKINETFGTELGAEDFSKVMAGIRSTTIDTSNFTNVEGKNNLDLVKWVIQAEKAGWGYVWGTSGEVLTNKAYEAQKKLYPSEVGGYADFIEKNWIGKRTADCSGLIRSYHWLNPKTGKIENGDNGIPAMTADGMYQAAKEKGGISSIPEIPGLAVWHSGHIGVYIGNGEVIEAMGTKYGVVRTKLANRGWTHWLKIPYIKYEKEKSNKGEKSDKKKSKSVKTAG